MAENWKYPRTKFVGTTSVSEQIGHVVSEVLETVASKSTDQFLEEVIDLEHSVETLIRIISEWPIRKYGKDILPEFREKVIAKNKARGYYVSEGSQKES